MAEFPASLLILNGKSTDNLPLREAIMLLREEGMTIHVRVTWEKGDAARYVEEARKLGVATVIAGGGDGTINEVSTALIQCEGDDIPALGILPLGTANDFATSVGIPEALDKALKLAIAGNAIAIDMAQVNKQTCFINMATGGFGTRITTETPEKLKAALGGVSYIINKAYPTAKRGSSHNAPFIAPPLWVAGRPRPHAPRKAARWFPGYRPGAP